MRRREVKVYPQLSAVMLKVDRTTARTDYRTALCAVDGRGVCG